MDLLVIGFAMIGLASLILFTAPAEKDGFREAILVSGVVIFLAGVYVLGLDLGASFSTVGYTQSDLGVPVEAVELDQSGLVLSLTLGNSEFQIELHKPQARPPRLESATRLYVDGDELVLVDSENKRLFEAQYTSFKEQ
jgi:hypothetical protein